MTGVGTSGPLVNRHSTCERVTSPRPPASDGEHRPLARWRVDDPVVDERRGDDAKDSVAGRIQSFGAPDFRAGRGIVTGDDIGAGDDDRGARAVAQRCVGVV